MFDKYCFPICGLSFHSLNSDTFFRANGLSFNDIDLSICCLLAAWSFLCGPECTGLSSPSDLSLRSLTSKWCLLQGTSSPTTPGAGNAYLPFSLLKAEALELFPAPSQRCVDPTRLVPAQGFGLPSPLLHPPPPPALGSSTVAGGGGWGRLPPFLSLNPSISSTLPVKSGKRKPANLGRLSPPSLWGQRQAGGRLSLPVPLSFSLFLAAGPRASQLRPQVPVSWSAQAAITNAIEWAA